jgi:hypothetical protein
MHPQRRRREAAKRASKGNYTPCKRCGGDQFISGAHANLPDEPCPTCNANAPSGADRVLLAAAMNVRQTRGNASALLGAAIQKELRRVKRKLAEAEWLLKELGEGAQGWSPEFNKRLDKYKFETGSS